MGKKSEKIPQMLRKMKTTVDRLSPIAYGGVKRMLRSKVKTKKTTKMRELFRNQSEKMTLFCSELVSLFLNEIGVLKQVRLLPKDFLGDLTNYLQTGFSYGAIQD